MTSALNAQGKLQKGKGRIAHQLQSIAGNVHHPSPFDAWTVDAATWNNYFAKGDVKGDDVVTAIAKALKANHSKPAKPVASKNGASPLQSPPATAQIQPRQAKLSDRATIAKHLFDHYGRVFGKDTTVKDLLDSAHAKHRLWLVHQRIKATYKALFDNASIEGLKHLHQRLPQNKGAMRTLIEQRKNNHDVSHLVRLGKVIHYHAAAEGKTVRAAWPDLRQQIESSPYWLSDGQAEIKRSEALVRVFKHAISHAGRTLTDLTQRTGGDIFLNAKKATENLSAQDCSERLSMLFGRSQGDLFPSSWGIDGQLSDALKTLLTQSIEAWAQLRHSSFHFKGRDGFLKALRDPRKPQQEPSDPLTAHPALDELATPLWARDIKARQERIKQTLEGAHCEQHLDQTQLQAVFDAISGKEGLRLSSELPLPRLNRVLTRAQNTQSKVTAGDQSINLPSPAKREALERNPASRCQYVLLKLLYEQSFAPWLLKKSFHEINKWITQAVEYTQTNARKLNGQGVQPSETIDARASSLWQSVSRELASQVLQGQNLMAYFFDQLAAATATEFRVQRYYEPDAEAARKQAAYIDNLKCDVVAMAFIKYLQEKFSWLLSALPGTAQSAVKDLSPNTANAASTTGSKVEDWQKRLYYLMHFVPVDVASQLLHQLRKWHILSTQEKDLASGEPLYEQCAQVLTLYLDMHDAKFDGGVAYHLGDKEREQLQGFFKRLEDFEKHFPRAQGTQADSRIPLRPLRELMRFGALGRLSPLFTKHCITQRECERFEALQQEIENAQSERETLHALWVKCPKTFPKKQRYGEVLNICQEHRHLSHRVRLLDQVKLHNLLIAVLARLADYAGLWERDLYFVTLALCYQQQLNLTTLFAATGKHGNQFDGGQIVEALRQIQPDA